MRWVQYRLRTLRPARTSDTTNAVVDGNTGVADPGGAQNAPSKVRQLGTVDVSAALDQSRNALSPDTGSSQYLIDQKAIQQMPLGDATPINQVLLQAPGVVQDSFGSCMCAAITPTCSTASMA